MCKSAVCGLALFMNCAEFLNGACPHHTNIYSRYAAPLWPQPISQLF